MQLSYTALQSIIQLAKEYPSNARWQRDLWVNCWKMADVCEKTGNPEATDWRHKAYEKLSEMKQRGLFISPQDEKVIQWLRIKLGQ